MHVIFDYETVKQLHIMATVLANDVTSADNGKGVMVQA